MNHLFSFLICIVVTFIKVNLVMKVSAFSAPTIYEKGEICRSHGNVPYNQLGNCRVFIGNIVIKTCNQIGPELPLLTEITGFLLVHGVRGLRSLEQLFPNLRIIHGNFLVHDFSLIIYDVPDLQEIGLSSLLKISRGSVRIQKNPLLCFADAIDWTSIASNGTGNILRDNKDVNECRVCGNESEEGNKSKAEVTTCQGILDSREPLCWNQEQSRVCPSNCGNLTCNLNGECCDELCVGCSNENPSVCLSCRYFTVESNSDERCVRSCPENTFEFENHRCVSKDECYATRKPRFVYHLEHLSDYPYFTHDGKCVTDCPRHFYVDADGPSGHRRCLMHTKGYIKECPSGSIVNYKTAQQYRKCTHIKGALTINLTNKYEDNIVPVLEHALSDIELINGPLSILHSDKLMSLGFFRKLRVVKGDPSGEEEYGLQVLKNKNLQALFTQNVTIENGHIFIQMNPNLCTNVIDGFIDFVNLRNTSALPANEVNANGDGSVCRSTNLDTSVTNITSNAVEMELKTISYEDKHLIYSLFYRIDPNKTVTKFDGRSNSENGEWKTVAYKNNVTSNTITATYLKPNTKYAYFLQCYTGKLYEDEEEDFSGFVRDELIATTPMKYFRTLPDPVTDLTATANGNSEITIQWGPPIESPSNVTKYIITWTLIPDDPGILQRRNYCKPEYPDIDPFEAEVYNILYVKWSMRRRRDVGAQSLLNNVTTAEALYTQNDMQKSSPSATFATQANDVSVSKLNLNKYVEVNASTFTLTLDQLKEHYSNYSITIKVCREGFYDNCHDEMTIYQRTSPLQEADDVTNLAVEQLHTPNNSTTTVRLTWNEPENPNGMIVSYTIRYGRVNKKYANYTETCVPQELNEDQNQQKSFILTNLINGNYIFSIATNSLAGLKARWSKPVCLQVD